MKKHLYTLMIFYAVLTASCSEESPIEGLIASKASVATINAEIATGANKTITLNINHQTLSLQIASSRTTVNGVESRDCSLAMANNAGVFALVPGSAYINTMAGGTEISAAAFGSPSFSGTLYFVTKQPNATSYNYVNTNGVRFDNSYYIPFKVVPGNGQAAPVYAYLHFTVAAEKVTLHKMVYRTSGSLSAGGE